MRCRPSDRDGGVPGLLVQDALSGESVIPAAVLVAARKEQDSCDRDVKGGKIVFKHRIHSQ